MNYVFIVIVLRMLRTVPLLNYLSCMIEFDSTAAAAAAAAAAERTGVFENQTLSYKINN